MQEEASSNPHPTPSPSQRPRGWKRRIAKACDSCRRKRTKCSGARPVCSQCSSTGSACHYSDALDRKPRPRSERASHAQRLEQRVHELEDALRQYRSLSPTQQSPTEAATRSTAQQVSEDTNEGETGPEVDGGRGTIVVEDTGELRYFGPSSSIAIISPDGLQWLESRTADASLRQRLELPLKGGGSWAKWTHPLLQSLSPTANSTPLPPWEDTLALVNEFLENYNTVLPIFHPPTFMGLLGRHYAPSANTADNPAWSAALNAVLALAQRSRAEKNVHSRDLADKAWSYANNALEMVLAVLMRSVSLLSVQAVVTLAWFFRGTPNPQPFFFLTAAAVRLSHSAGLHRKTKHPALSPTDVEQRLRVFWIALILDSSASLRTGRPCTQSVDDIGVRLPSDSPKDNLGIIMNRRGTAVLNFLSAKAKFAILEGRIYDRIFAACSAEKSMDALNSDVIDLGRELEEWSHMIPGGTTCSATIADHWVHQHPHIISLLLGYHTCTMTVHSATWQRQFSSARRRKSSHRDFRVSPAVFPHTEKCLRSAHEIINILRFVPQENNSFIWEIIHRPIQAMMLLFICVLQQPDHADADSHLRAMGDAAAFMSISMANQEPCFMHPLLVVGQELMRVARAAIQKSRTRAEKAQAQQAPPDQHAGAIARHGDRQEQNFISDLSNQSSTIPPTDGDEFAETAMNEAQAAEDLGHTTAQQPTTYGGYQETWPLDQGFTGMEQFSDLLLPFPWNWQDLSNGLLEDFDL